MLRAVHSYVCMYIRYVSQGFVLKMRLESQIFYIRIFNKQNQKNNKKKKSTHMFSLKNVAATGFSLLL